MTAHRTIELIAPSGYPQDPAVLHRALHRLQAEGHRVDGEEATRRRYQRFAGTDGERAADLNRLADPSRELPDVVLAVRGGYGAVRILHGLDYTHDLTRLSRGAPLVAVNTTIEIDQYGQINVEGLSDKVIGGIGGHPDYCAAARMSSGGLSIIAAPTRVNGRSPLVEQLSRPVSTPAHDVDVIVTESGHVDLRAADWSQRRALIAELFTD